MKKSRLLALLIAMVMVASLFTGCTPTETGGDTTAPSTSGTTTTTPGGSSEPVTVDLTGHKDPKEYTYNTYTSSFAKDWNPHTWASNADDQIRSYISSGMYEFKFNEDQTAGELFPVMAASDPIDVTSKLTAAQKEKYGIPADATDSYAYQYPLRKDMTFNDGTVINAQTFVDSVALLLDPARLNSRAADEMTGEAPIAGAQGYFNQGSVAYVPADGSSDTSGGVFFSMSNANTWWGGSLDSIDVNGSNGKYFEYDGVNLITKWNDFALANGGYDSKGYFQIPDESLEEFIADWSLVCNTYGGKSEGEWKEFIFVAGTDYTDPKYSDISNVGVIADDEFTVTFVYSVQVTPFNAKYYQTSSFLVNPTVYEMFSKTDGGYTTTTYNSGVDNSSSFGPYILSQYEADKEMLFVRNESWFGYNMEELDGCYQADRIRMVMLADQPTALLSFLKGEIDIVTLVATDLVDYGTSDYLLITPTTYLYRLFYNIGEDVLKGLDADESSNSNTVALTNKNFRLALSMALDRNELTKISNRIPAFAMLNNMYTYDYEGEMNDGVTYRYRDLDIAKEAILNIYGMSWGAGTPYATLDMAVDAVTGYDPDLAKTLFKQAFEELTADPNSGFDPTKAVNIQLGWSPSNITPTALAFQAEMNDKFAAAIEGSGFVGFTFEFIVDQDRYAGINDDRLAVSYGAIGGARQNPFGTTRTYLDPDYSVYYAGHIPVRTETLEITAKFDDVNVTSQTKTLYDWCIALNYEFLYSSLETRATILAALESHYLKQGYTTPIEAGMDTQMHAIRTSYPLDEADPIMGFGGIQYCSFSMDDAEWAAYISANISEGSLAYK